MEQIGDLSKAVAQINKFRNTSLVAAARMNDECVQENGNLRKTIEDLGVKPDVLEHVLQQRIMRLELERFRQATPEELLRIAYLDGILIGWTAQRYERDGIPEKTVIKDPITTEEFKRWNG